jgi:rRNA maturation RNase YbeY
MILNRQRTVRVAQRPLQLFLRRLQEHLGLSATDVTICLVSDAEITRMNQAFRKKKGPTDVLSFPAVARRTPVAMPRLAMRTHPSGAARQGPASAAPKSDLNLGASAPEVPRPRRRNIYATPSRVKRPRTGSAPAAIHSEYLGDVAIAPATARRNAKELGRTLPNELQILILHGVLHLLGYDHETDRGEMNRFEQRLRRRLGLA